MSIKLIKFEVELCTDWASERPHKQFYKSKAHFTSKEMDFRINLPPDVGELVVKLLKGQIAEASQGALERLTLEAKDA